MKSLKSGFIRISDTRKISGFEIPVYGQWPRPKSGQRFVQISDMAFKTVRNPNYSEALKMKV